MTQEISIGGRDAFALFPDLMKNAASASPPKAAAPPVPTPLPAKAAETAPVTGRRPAPPPPPDISWLSQGRYEARAAVSTEPTALLLMTGEEGRAEVAKAFQGIGYQIALAGSQSEAIARVKAFDFMAVVMDADFSGVSLANSPFHTFMKWLPMQQRRTIHYTFVGPQVHTLYSLEALAESVNLVVNTCDTKHFDVILRKTLAEGNALFQPYVAALSRCKQGP